MNPDQLALSGFEQRLREDRSGSLLKSTSAFLEKQIHLINTQIENGLTPEKFKDNKQLKNTLVTSVKVLAKVWHGFHGQ